MSSFWENIKKLFLAAEQSSSNDPVLHTTLERTEQELIDYKRWEDSAIKNRLLDWIQSQHFNFLTKRGNKDEAIDFLDTPSTKGFVLHFYKTRYNKQEITHLFDFFKNQILNLGYKKYLSDTRSYNKKEWVEREDRHYLKPPVDIRKAGLEKMDQSFGNVTIELLYRNEKIYLLKFRATVYSDRLYKEGGDFNKLMRLLIGNH